jgi:hypothetical protein
MTFELRVQSGGERAAVQALARLPMAHEFREASGLRRLQRRFRKQFELST